MEDLQGNLTTLTGAVNRLLQEMKTIEARLRVIEGNRDIEELKRRLDLIEPGDVDQREAVSVLQPPRNEEELNSICRLPDSVKELRTFDGNPLNYVSWVHAVEMVLRDFEIVRHKPIYRSILQSIRQKIVGEADAALVSYNIFDNDWKEVKKVLSLHYADKRDVQTLEHQLNQLSQGSSKVDEFYSTVNHQLSLIINKIKTETYSEETIDALVTTHRNRALDIFIRGLNPDLSRMVIIQRPRTLPEAYSACLELQNLTMRNKILHSRSQPRSNEPVAAPITRPFSRAPRPPLNFSNNARYNYHHHGHSNAGNRSVPHPRFQYVKPEPMETDNSTQTRRTNYINRPNNTEKRRGSEIFRADKQPRVYHLNTEVPNEEIVPIEELSMGNFDSAAAEQNFMQEGHPAYLT